MKILLITTKRNINLFTVNYSDINLATVRGGNVIGGGDWSQDRLIPDCVKSWALKNLLALSSKTLINISTDIFLYATG